MTETQRDISDLAKKINDHLWLRLQNNELTINDRLSIIETVGSTLNLMTISDYAKSCGLTYNGALDRMRSGKAQEYNLFNVKMVIDEE